MASSISAVTTPTCPLGAAGITLASQFRPSPSSQPQDFSSGGTPVSLPGPPRTGPDAQLGIEDRVRTHKHSSSEKVRHRHGGEALCGGREGVRSTGKTPAGPRDQA